MRVFSGAVWSVMPSREVSHPDHFDRNAAILWARDLLNRDDWWIIAFATSRQPSGSISAALLSRDGKLHLAEDPLVDCVDFCQRLSVLGAGRQFVCWDAEVAERCLTAIAAAAGELNLAIGPFLSVQEQHARFVGEKGNASGASANLPAGLPAGADAQVFTRAILDVVFQMAGSSQVIDAAATTAPGWSAAFYKPKSTPADKLKNLFGLK